MPPTDHTRQKKIVSHWHTRYRRDIYTLQAQHARNVKALSVKAKVDVATARRLIDQRTKHFRNPNLWNIFQEWVKWKRNRVNAEPVVVAGEPSGSEVRVTETETQPDVDLPALPSSTSRSDLYAAYEALTSANKKAIKGWAKERVGNKPALDNQKEFNLACGDLLSRITNLQLRFGISAVAILAHPGEGIIP
ncbi:hypothetical protein CF319_g6978 [Tilletia indica]|nr:hypothetical protein CF319_g6978 [Tilletia indica]